IWSSLEVALYWKNQGVIDLLMARGASVDYLRIASALVRIDLMESFFRSDGSLKPEAGTINWPFGDFAKSSLNTEIKAELQAKSDGWSNDQEDIVNNAFVYA